MNDRMAPDREEKTCPMQVNLHTHTFRCGHAKGTEREYVEAAIAAGIRVLGFSDHVPYPFPEGCGNPGVRMKPEEAETYAMTLASLREEYRSDIRILIGYEAEYYPRHFTAMLRHILRFPCDYLILGQHFLHNEYDGTPNSRGSDREEDYAAYVDQTVEGMETGVFTYLAHPDLFRYRGDDASYVRQSERLCLAAKRLQIPLEINLLGVAEERHYPRRLFWETVSRVGNTVVLGSDAHAPRAVLRPDAIERAKRMASDLGLTLKMFPVLRDPRAFLSAAENEKD